MFLGEINADSRYPDWYPGVKFIPFAKPKRQLEKCLRWIKACGRPHSLLNVEKTHDWTYICSRVSGSSTFCLKVEQPWLEWLCCMSVYCVNIMCFVMVWPYAFFLFLFFFFSSFFSSSPACPEIINKIIVCWTKSYQLINNLFATQLKGYVLTWLTVILAQWQFKKRCTPSKFILSPTISYRIIQTIVSFTRHVCVVFVLYMVYGRVVCVHCVLVKCLIINMAV